MTEYRGVLRHVRYWRGNVHHWSTVYSLVGSAALSGTSFSDQIRAAESAICFSNSDTGNDGGIYQVQLYEAGVSMPIESTDYFDPATPSGWAGYNSSAWDDGTRELEPAAEVAMLIKWPAGLGRTGKPVFFRHWIHAVPVSASILGTPDIGSSQLATLVSFLPPISDAAVAHGMALGNSRRLADLTGTVIDEYYQNHQMPRGRRRKSA